MRWCGQGNQSIVVILFDRYLTTITIIFVEPLFRMIVPVSIILYMCMYMYIFLSLSYPSVKSNVMWRPRGLSQPTNMLLVTSHGISEHNRARYRGDTFPSLFPSSSLPASHPSNSLLVTSLSHAHENAFLLALAEKRVSLSRGEQGFGGRNDYLLTFTRTTSYARKSSAAWVLLS